MFPKPLKQDRVLSKLQIKMTSSRVEEELINGK